MDRPGGATSKARQLDNLVEVPGGHVGTDPYRRWGPIFHWTWQLVHLPLWGNPGGSFDKRDVVVIDSVGNHELYREGPFTAQSALARQRSIVREIGTCLLYTSRCV